MMLILFFIDTLKSKFVTKTSKNYILGLLILLIKFEEMI